MPEVETLYSVKEAAELSGYHPKSLRRLLATGKFDAIRIGYQWLFDQGMVDELKARKERSRQ